MIVGISGKINSGKDTVGKIIQIITRAPHFNNNAVIDFLEREIIKPEFEIKKFADKLKDIVCLLIECTREQLEDRDFKEKELGEEWDKYAIMQTISKIKRDDFTTRHNPFVYYSTENEAIINKPKDRLKDFSDTIYTVKKIKLTPRLLLQLMGTECGRQIIHPNIWVNALMSEYKGVNKYAHGIPPEKIYPNWVITDMRFPNELKAVEDKKGITIRINRNGNPCVCVDDTSLDCLVKCDKKPQHESETALDNAKFDHIIYNNGNLNELIDDVRYILTKEKLL